MGGVIAQQQPIKFDVKAIRIGGHCMDASRLEKEECWSSLTDSSQVHYACALPVRRCYQDYVCNHE